jgi:hypothetical protein
LDGSDLRRLLRDRDCRRNLGRLAPDEEPISARASPVITPRCISGFPHREVVVLGNSIGDVPRTRNGAGALLVQSSRRCHVVRTRNSGRHCEVPPIA